MTIDGKFARDFDWLLFLVPIGLVLFGTIFIYSSQPTQDYWIKQLIWLGIGVPVCAVLSVSDYRKLQLVAPVFYGAMILALVLVLIPWNRREDQRPARMDQSRIHAIPAVRVRQARARPRWRPSTSPRLAAEPSPTRRWRSRPVSSACRSF